MTQDQCPSYQVKSTPAAILGGTCCSPFPKLGEKEIHVWIVDTTALPSANTSSVDLLSPEERTRASKFRFDVDRTRFVWRRSALRVILAGYLGIAARDIEYSVNAFGKPAVSMTMNTKGAREWERMTGDVYQNR